MNLLPNELIIIIFNYIQKITDKRQFLRTCKTYNKITKQSMLEYVCNYNVSQFNYKHKYSVETFTLEICHDGYFNLIPEHYINKNNKILVSCLAYYNNVPLLELAKLKNCHLTYALEYSVLGGHIPMLVWCTNNNFNKDLICCIAIKCGHLHILKWLQECKYNFDIKSSWTCNKAVEKSQLEILKFLRGIGCNWNSTTYQYALRTGDRELIEWMIENGCPTY